MTLNYAKLLGTWSIFTETLMEFYASVAIAAAKRTDLATSWKRILPAQTRNFAPLLQFLHDWLQSIAHGGNLGRRHYFVTFIITCNFSLMCHKLWHDDRILPRCDILGISLSVFMDSCCRQTSSESETRRKTTTIKDDVKFCCVLENASILLQGHFTMFLPTTLCFTTSLRLHKQLSGNPCRAAPIRASGNDLIMPLSLPSLVQATQAAMIRHYGIIPPRSCGCTFFIPHILHFFKLAATKFPRTWHNVHCLLGTVGQTSRENAKEYNNVL